jgi:tetratricopeptide (TPR) repeat protein
VHHAPVEKVPDLSRDESLRYALITPRLVAPHPNAEQTAAPAAYEAVALLVAARLRDATGVTCDTGIPSIAEALESEEWSWRFFGAVGRHLLRGSIDELFGLMEQASTSDERAAAAAIAGAALIQTDRTDEAIPLLEKATADEDISSVDHAWLTMQLARALAEVGRLDEARGLAVRVYGVASRFPNDPTASALAGVAAILLFNTSSWGAHDLQQVVRAADTAALWRVTQAASRGLTTSVQRSFETWARRAPHRVGRWKS